MTCHVLTPAINRARDCSNIEMSNDQLRIVSEYTGDEICCLVMCSNCRSFKKYFEPDN